RTARRCAAAGDHARRWLSGRLRRMSSFGVWLVGAAGNVGACTVAGWAAVRAGLLPPTGLVTFAPALEGVAFAPLDGVAFGGHDLGPRYLADAALGLVREG